MRNRAARRPGEQRTRPAPCRHRKPARRVVAAPTGKCKARLYAGFCRTGHPAVTIIRLGAHSRARSSHLPAASPSRVIGCLFGVAARRDCPFHPARWDPARRDAFAFADPRDADAPLAAGPRQCANAPPQTSRLVSVALILTFRWAGVTCYAALRSPDVPLAARSHQRSSSELCSRECRDASAVLQAGWRQFRQQLSAARRKSLRRRCRLRP